MLDSECCERSFSNGYRTSSAMVASEAGGRLEASMYVLVLSGLGPSRGHRHGVDCVSECDFLQNTLDKIVAHSLSFFAWRE